MGRFYLRRPDDSNRIYEVMRRDLQSAKKVLVVCPFNDLEILLDYLMLGAVPSQLYAMETPDSIERLEHSGKLQVFVPADRDQPTIHLKALLCHPGAAWVGSLNLSKSRSFDLIERVTDSEEFGAIETFIMDAISAVKWNHLKPFSLFRSGVIWSDDALL